MKFDISNYLSSSIVVHVSTEEEAKIFCNYMHKLGKRWNNGESYAKENYFYNYKEKTCYSLTGFYSNYDYYRSAGYSIIEFKDYEWKETNDEKREERKVLLSDIEILLSNTEREIYLLQKYFEEATELLQKLKEEL